MICVECGAPAADVYKEYGGKGNGNIRLTRCANCMKIGLVYVMFEAGLKYFSSHHVGQDLNYPYLLGDQLAYEQYLYTVGLTLVEYVSYILAVVISARLLLGKTHYAIVKYNYLAMAVILSSFGKPLHLFLMVWDYQQLFSTILDVFVVISNVMAVRAFLNDAKQAMLVVAVGFTVRLLTRLILSAHYDAAVPFTFFIN